MLSDPNVHFVTELCLEQSVTNKLTEQSQIRMHSLEENLSGSTLVKCPMVSFPSAHVILIFLSL